MKEFQFNLLKYSAACLGIILGTGLEIAVSQESDEDPKVPLLMEALVSERDQLLAEKLDVLKDKYVTGLEAFRKTWAEENQLDDALHALELKNQLEEQKSLEVPSEKLRSIRGELRRVIGAWNAAESKYQKEADAVLKKKLQVVRVDAIKKGDLALVKAVDRKLTELSPAAQSQEMTDKKKKENDKSLPILWNWGSGGTFQMLPDGTALHSRWGSMKGKWEWTRKGRRIELTHPNGSLMEIELNRNGTGDVTPETGRPTTITPQKQKPDAK